MKCTGNCYNCHLCSVKIVNENLLEENRGRMEKISPILENDKETFIMTEEDERGASEAFDRPIETGLSVVEIPQYELKKNIFGKEVVKKVR